jgi:hypothetical protein
MLVGADRSETDASLLRFNRPLTLYRAVTSEKGTILRESENAPAQALQTLNERVGPLKSTVEI